MFESNRPGVLKPGRFENKTPRSDRSVKTTAFLMLNMQKNVKQETAFLETSVMDEECTLFSFGS